VKLSFCYRGEGKEVVLLLVPTHRVFNSLIF